MATVSSTQNTQAMDGQLAESFEYCRDVARKRARNFYYGMKLTPEPKRSAMYAIYAWMRAADDLADGTGLADAARMQRIGAFCEMTDAVLDAEGDLPEADAADPHARMWPALRQVVHAFDIPLHYFHLVIEGQELDQQRTRYETFEPLYDYCYKVASVVGLVCVRVWGADGDPRIDELAEYRGVALQLTNILRDLVEDAQRDRVYLPADELARFGYGPEEFAQAMRDRQADERFDALMAFQVGRVEDYYRKASGLEPHVDADCRATCWAMMRIYHGLLQKIARRPRRVLTQRVRLSSLEKASIALWAVGQRGMCKSPASAPSR